MLAQALEALTPTLRDVAAWLGTNYESVKSYRLRRRAAPPETARQLARILRERARTLEGLADTLDNEVKRNP